MRVELKTLLEKLGVKRDLQAYETHPWLHYDSDKGITCSAEVRMGPGAVDLEAEIQFLKDYTDEDDEAVSEDENDGLIGPGPHQMLRMRAEPVKDSEWSPKQLVVKGEDYMNKIAGWEEKGCALFKAAIQAIQMGELPDIENLIERELQDESAGGGRRGRVGRKSPKVKPGALLGMKKPGG